jgi:hypothetical protein
MNLDFLATFSSRCKYRSTGEKVARRRHRSTILQQCHELEILD